MESIIKTNPFRVIGVYSNSSIKEITANKGRITAFAKVGKTTDFPADLTSILPRLTRTVESIDEAVAKINLPNDKIKHALFWFVNSSPIDNIALGHIQAGNMNKALEIFDIKETFSSLLNKGVYSFIYNDKETAISCITKVIHGSEYRREFINAICGDTFSISEEELAKLFIDELLKVSNANDLLKIFIDSGTSADDDKYLKEAVIKKPITIIQSEISRAKSCGDSPSEEYNAGVALIKNTKSALRLLKANLSTNDLQYQTVVDALARQILQCGINYFNTTDDEDDVDKALTLQEYAQKIAVSKLLKDRCAENIETLKQRKELGEVSEPLMQMMNELKSFSTRVASISTVREFVQRCIPKLIIIKSKLGAEHDMFVKMSTAVVNNALQMLVEVVNREQESKSSVFDGALRSSIDGAIHIINDLKTLTMDSQCRIRLSQNERILHDIQSQVTAFDRSLKSTRSVRPAQKYNSSQTDSSKSESSSSEFNVGCIVMIVLGIILLFIMNS